MKLLSSTEVIQTFKIKLEEAIIRISLLSILNRTVFILSFRSKLTSFNTTSISQIKNRREYQWVDHFLRRETDSFKSKIILKSTEA